MSLVYYSKEGCQGSPYLLIDSSGLSLKFKPKKPRCEGKILKYRFFNWKLLDANDIYLKVFFNHLVHQEVDDMFLRENKCIAHVDLVAISAWGSMKADCENKKNGTITFYESGGCKGKILGTQNGECGNRKYFESMEVLGYFKTAAEKIKGLTSGSNSTSILGSGGQGLSVGGYIGIGCAGLVLLVLAGIFSRKSKDDKVNDEEKQKPKKEDEEDDDDFGINDGKLMYKNYKSRAKKVEAFK